MAGGRQARQQGRCGVNELMTRAAADWAANTTHHTVTVLHDEGLYRHVRYAHRDSDLYMVNVVTWPGHLAVSGDVRGFVFRRTQDMFEFFRAEPAGRLNPGYWAEKVIDGRERCRSWNQDLFDTRVAEILAAAEATHPGVTEKWKANTTGFWVSYDLSTETAAREAVVDFSWISSMDWSTVWRFPNNAFDWASFQDWDWHYLRSCHAVRATIAAYDAARVPTVIGGAA